MYSWEYLAERAVNSMRGRLAFPELVKNACDKEVLECFYDEDGERFCDRCKNVGVYRSQFDMRRHLCSDVCLDSKFVNPIAMMALAGTHCGISFREMDRLTRDAIFAFAVTNFGGNLSRMTMQRRLHNLNEIRRQQIPTILSGPLSLIVDELTISNRGTILGVFGKATKRDTDPIFLGFVDVEAGTADVLSEAILGLFDDLDLEPSQISMIVGDNAAVVKALPGRLQPWIGSPVPHVGCLNHSLNVCVKAFHMPFSAMRNLLASVRGYFFGKGRTFDRRRALSEYLVAHGIEGGIADLNQFLIRWNTSLDAAKRVRERWTTLLDFVTQRERVLPDDLRGLNDRVARAEIDLVLKVFDESYVSMFTSIEANRLPDAVLTRLVDWLDTITALKSSPAELEAWSRRLMIGLDEELTRRERVALQSRVKEAFSEMVKVDRLDRIRQTVTLLRALQRMERLLDGTAPLNDGSATVNEDDLLRDAAKMLNPTHEVATIDQHLDRFRVNLGFASGRKRLQNVFLNARLAKSLIDRLRTVMHSSAIVERSFSVLKRVFTDSNFQMSTETMSEVFAARFNPHLLFQPPPKQ
jgi:hypothetical protein